MKSLKKLDRNLLTAIIVAGISLVGFVSSCFLISSELQDIPFGFLFAGGVIAAVHVISFAFNKIDERRASATFTIIAMALRLVIMLAMLIIIALMNYRWNIKLFNIFVFVGVYLVGIVVLCLTFIFDKSAKGEDAR